MDKINGLPDELLVKILSFVPTKVAVSSSVLSKRWKFLWMWSPKLEYATQYANYRPKPGLREFINKNLPLHRAPVIESLCLELSDSQANPEDIKLWIDIAVSRYLRELEISDYLAYKYIFPSSFYTCKLLVIFKLSYGALVDIPSMVCLPSLKTLHLRKVKYADEESLQLLLSICPVLEDLTVYFCHDNHVKNFTIIVPSLQSLSLFVPKKWYSFVYMIDTPSLKYLKLEDWSRSRHYSLIKNMPKLREAYVDVKNSSLPSVFGSITSVKHMTICSEDAYGDGFVFDQLEHLTLCVCKKKSSNLLGQLLKDSPNMRVLDISLVGDHWDDEIDMVSWNQPSHVPECMLSSLQVFNSTRYFGRPRDRDIAVYILKNCDN